MKEKIIEEMNSYLDSATSEQLQEDFEEMKALKDGPIASEYTDDACRFVQTGAEHHLPETSFVLLPTPTAANQKYVRA